jgi:hypothetical protein
MLLHKPPKNGAGGDPVAADQDEIGLAGERMQPGDGAQEAEEAVPLLGNRLGPRGELRTVLEHHLRRRQGDRVHVVGQLGLRDLPGDIRMSQCVAEAEAGHAHRLR